MYLIGFLIIAACIYFVFFNKKTTSDRQQPKQSLPKPMAPHAKQGATAFDNPIPPGYQIFAAPPVAGMNHRKDSVVRFAQGDNQDLAIERDPDNPHDRNAIKLIGVLGTTRYHIGYLPKELAEQIAATELFDSLKVRLTRIYIGTDDYIEIHYHILGPKPEKRKFDSFLDNQPADAAQKDYLKFFGLAIPKGMTAGQAKEIIKQHGQTSSDEEQDEWTSYTNILEQFDDTDFREDYEIKKVPKTVLLKAMNDLKAEGKSYSHLEENTDELIDRIIKEKPELARKR
jgi:hypothetical protein